MIKWTRSALLCAALASGCKTTMETAKQSLSVYSCEW